MIPSLQYDAVIVGGGPAGSLTGLQLARMGWRVAICERGGRLRGKTCGHCLHARAIPMLARLGLLESVRDVCVGQTRGVNVHGAGVNALRANWEQAGGSDGMLVPRNLLDQALRDAATTAGVDVREGCSARIVGVDAGVVRIKSGDMELRTRLVVGADGVGSRIARHAGLASAENAGRCYAFAFDAPLTGGSFALGEINMFLSEGGYLGCVVNDRDVCHGAALVRGRADAMSEPTSFLRTMASRHRVLRELGVDQSDARQMKGFTAVGPMPWRSSRVAGEWCALVGDAAGYVEPFTGEGMCWAMESSIILAEVLGREAPGTWNARSAARYERRWRQEIGARQRLCSLVTTGLKVAALSRFALRFGSLAPVVVNRVVARVVCG